MPNHSKGTVLIIEDNVLNLDMASELLEMDGFNILRAEDAITGIQLARENKPDLILMDLHLPYQDGFTTTRTIKTDPELKDIPIVAFTALAMREDQEKALNYGCSGVISKPINVNSFARTIEGYISNSSRFHQDLDGANRQPVTAAAVRNADDVEPKPEAYDRPQESEYFVTRNSRSRMASTAAGYETFFQDEDARADTTDESLEMVMPKNIPTHLVMVVDDNVMNVELLKDALESMGQRVIPVYNGKTALKLLQQEPDKPDLILLDIMMPDMDGYEVLENLKKNPETAEIPVIFISALNKTQDMVRGFQQGTYDYITKPFKIEEVKARILASLRIKDLQDSLRTERDKLSTIFRFSADGIALLDKNMEVLSANPRFAQWFSLTLSPEGLPQSKVSFYQLLGCQCNDSGPCPVHENSVALCEEDVVSGSKADSPDEKKGPQAMTLLENVTVTDEEGQSRFLNIHCSRVQASSQNPEGYVVVLRDVTKEKTIQQSKETFVATLTHDLKTPIRAEFQALQLLMNESFGPLTQEQQEILKEILQSNRYMSSLVESLLTTYLYEEGKIELKPEQINLNDLIQQDIAKPLSTLAEAKHQGMALQLNPDLPLVWIDPIEIHRVLNNLVQNAITYTPEGGVITISTDFRDNSVWVGVRDTGRGIEPEHIPLLFDRYKSMAKKFQNVGTGLGLYLSKKIIQAHHGEIGVESEEGKGSLFYFTLPVSPAPVQPPTAQDTILTGNA